MKTIKSRSYVVEADNLSIGWAKVFDRLMTKGVDHISPLVLTITGFDEEGVPSEDREIRSAMDAFLRAQEKRDTENVAWTIFPKRYLQLAGGDRHKLYAMFLDAFPRIQKFNPHNNRRGSYFQRLIDLSGDGKGPNQLEWMLDQYHNTKAHRRSKFQATTFDPVRDYSSTGQLEFPCLQQISFTFDESSGELSLNAFYATQQIGRKGYGNYLGLARLGAFMAREMGLKLERLVVFVGQAQMDAGKTDADVQALYKVVKERLLANSSNSLAA